MANLYEIQRAMRSKRRDALQRGVVAVLDLGTTKTACIVIKFYGQNSGTQTGSFSSGARFRVMGTATIQSGGIRFGEVNSVKETESAIRIVLTKAQKMAQTSVSHIIACFSGGRPQSTALIGNVELNGSPISESDVAMALASCEIGEQSSGREILHAHPINFSVDHRAGLVDPRGQVGNVLSVDLHLLTANRAAIENVIECAKHSYLELAGVASSAYVSGISSLVEDEQELGSACVDIGGGVTGISTFFKKHMVHTDVVNIGGGDITADIGHAFSVPVREAERVKIKYGSAVATSRDDREYVDLSFGGNDWERGNNTITKTELIGVIRPRVEEILEMVRDSLNSCGFSGLPGQRIVLTGGASNLPGLEHLARQILGAQIRFGKPIRLQGLPQAMAGPQFSSAVGLCLYAACPQDEWWDFPIPYETRPQQKIGKIIRWFRENW